MLQQMRKFSKSWFSTALLGALALSFVIWGIGDIFRGAPNTTVASIGGTRIDQTYFSREYRNTVRSLGQRFGKDITPDEARRLGLPRNTLDRLMDEAALNNYANSFGLMVSPEQVDREIQSISAFNGVLGTFDYQTFLSRLQQLGYSEQEFRMRMQLDMTRSQLRVATEDGLSAPTGYVAALMNYINEARVAEYIIVTPETVGAIAPPDDKTLMAYIAAHEKRFSTPEYRTLTYAVIGPEDVMSKITVTDKQLHDAYDQHKAEYVVPEKRDADQINFPTEAEATAARARLSAGTTFDALAAERKLSAKAIDMGTVSKDQLDKAQADALFALPENGISAPVKSSFGWSVMRVRKISPAINKSFDDAKADLEKQLKTELAASNLVDITNTFTDKEGSGDDVGQAARASGMRVVNVSAVDANGMTPEGTKAEVPAGADFMKSVFTAEIGLDGDVFQAPDGHWYALKVSGSTPPKLKSLDIIRADAIAAWTKDTRAKTLAAKAKALAEQANREGRLSGAVQTSGRLARDTKNDTFSAELIAAIFAKPAGVAVSGPLGKGEGYVVARTTGISHGKFTQNDQNFRAIGRALSQQVAGDITESLAAAEKARQKSSIDQKLLDQAAGQESS